MPIDLEAIRAGRGASERSRVVTDRSGFGHLARSHVVSNGTRPQPAVAPVILAPMVQRLTIPGPPVGKGRPRHTASGHSFTPAKTRAAEERIRGLALAAGIRPMTGRLSLAVYFYCDTIRGDVDNMAKLASDALNGIAYNDDGCIDVIHAVRSFDWYNPRTEVTIKVLSVDPPKRPRNIEKLRAAVAETRTSNPRRPS